MDSESKEHSEVCDGSSPRNSMEESATSAAGPFEAAAAEERVRSAEAAAEEAQERERCVTGYFPCVFMSCWAVLPRIPLSLMNVHRIFIV